MRKPPKKTARKPVRRPNKIIIGLKQALKHVRRTKRAVPPQRKADPFWIDERKIPAGWGYAWKDNQRPGGELPPGWRMKDKYAVPD